MPLETVALDHLPPSHRLYLALFRNVSNASFLRQQLLARNADFEYAFIDASVLLSRQHLLSAVFKAVLAAVNGSLKTPNVHSEIVLVLSGSNNISEAYRRFGISPSTKNLLVVKVCPGTEVPSSDAIWQHLQANVQGEATAATDENIHAATDLVKIRKYYKLNGLKWLEAIKDDKEMRLEMEVLAIGSMAIRGL